MGGITRIVENAAAVAILPLIINLAMLVVGAFILYCVSYPLTALYRYLLDNRKTLGVFVLLVTYAMTLFMLPVQEADAAGQHKESIKKGVLWLTAAVCGVSFSNKVSRLVEEAETAVTNAVHGAIEDAWDWLTQSPSEDSPPPTTNPSSYNAPTHAY